MLSTKQIEEIRGYLKKSENPLFFFDDDPDGLCSYLLLKKYIDKGKGVVLKTKPILEEGLYMKVREYNPDYIFILDIPIVEQEFIDKANVPIIWLDHHKPIDRKGVKYFNPRLNDDKNNKPTTYWAHKITEEKFPWLAAVGTISDWYYPSFAKEFSKQNPKLLPTKIKTPDEAIFNSKLGDIITIFTMVLKNATSKVHRMANLLMKIEDPWELLENETSRSKFINREISKHMNEYEILFEKIDKLKPTKEKIFQVYLPPTKNSYTSTISNYLIYKYPEKVIMVIRQNEEKVIMSLRSTKTKLPDAISTALEGLDGFGGGHELACGAGVAKDQFPEFFERLQSQLI
ncbi:DHH family phosphoesterase [Candidatus Woesearchaeota archaeon]|jgi:single-stranded DNA-specific DHH superfamily exonuclease|nr:DHH family phosphoesterase [Candidatus Woesearchaeota archaeon]MBT4835474.1 DHH family phosphoesterase [Candidatus Woesearchaeota archaeon]MBT6734834.1 DHH family phosphoesterase [Candidatus Woesearchaeota archaeon]MBT7169651.1 DHH family phosphoesterase [Candidatus Woesearchaeota archaeon]MBT7474609.1 DHH family phosphoesterase [Candidatus Woesearchaeota archaeon]